MQTWNWKFSSTKWKIDESKIFNLSDSDVLLGCTQLFLERKGKRIRSYKVDLMHKNVNFFIDNIRKDVLKVELV